MKNGNSPEEVVSEGIAGSLVALLDSAVACHQQGKLAEAQKLYEQILQKNSRHFDALHLLGVISAQAGRFAEAEELISRALRVNPNVAEAHSNRGTALRELRRLEEAIASYDRAIALKPDFAEAYTNRGTAFSGLKRLEDALANHDKAILLKPEYADAHSNRGNALKELGRLEESVVSYDRAIALKPDHAEAYYNRGGALKDLKRLEQAIDSCDKAIALKPDFAEAYINRGNALEELKRLEEALDNYDMAIALRPDYAEAHYNRGNALKELERLEEAIISYDRATTLKPDFADAHWNKGFALLLRGDFASGWRCYEWRKLKDEPVANRKYSCPVWLGAEPITGKRLLVHWEQGLGDTLQFCRYVPLLQQAGAKVLFAPQKPLKRLMRSLGPSFDIVDENDPALDFDFHCPLLSLPLTFDTTLASIPNQTPYLNAEPGLVEHWRSRLSFKGVRVGIAWQGNPQGGRSIPLRAFAPLARTAGVDLISLQKNEKLSESLELPLDIKIHRLEEFDAGSDAFLDTAAIMMNLDLVITSDTSVAHLAGALARPVWVALKHAPDWRWMLERNDSPWYPSMRLFRQPRPGDWGAVITEMVIELGKLSRKPDA